MARREPTPLPCCITPGIFEAGCDEAGRGCLAGPVVAAAVILPDGFTHPWLIDSKKLSEQRREQMREVVLANAVACAVGICSPAEIDEINILNASILAMHRALDGLTVRPGAIAVDGNRFKAYGNIPHTTVVKGDARYAHIAAASILAKTTRDRIMTELDSEFPVYGWAVNKGYPTAAHRAAIAEAGPCGHHRRSFRLF
ncbi:MAG: ribonuclease HII [Bacteroidales bacterium]|nr:ribonuclease HII [Bacteroidales bacterium]